MRNRNHIFIAVLVAMLSLAIWYGQYRTTPNFAYRRIKGIQAATDIDHLEDYMTPQGKEVLCWLFEHRQDVGSRPTLKVGDPQIRSAGSTCSIAFGDGDDRGYMEFYKAGDFWQFNDLLMTKLNGREVNIRTSEMIKFPTWTEIKNADWRSFVDVCLTCFDLALRARGR